VPEAVDALPLLHALRQQTVARAADSVTAAQAGVWRIENSNECGDTL
jgi:hypothetical protein